MEGLDLGAVITVVIAILGVVGGGAAWLKVKGKLGKVVTAGKELWDVGDALKDALEDDKVTKEEIDKVVKEWKEAQVAVKAIFKK